MPWDRPVKKPMIAEFQGPGATLDSSQLWSKRPL